MSNGMFILDEVVCMAGPSAVSGHFRFEQRGPQTQDSRLRRRSSELQRRISLAWQRVISIWSRANATGSSLSGTPVQSVEELGLPLDAGHVGILGRYMEYLSEAFPPREKTSLSPSGAVTNEQQMLTAKATLDTPMGRNFLATFATPCWLSQLALRLPHTELKRSFAMPDASNITAPHNLSRPKSRSGCCGREAGRDGR